MRATIAYGVYQGMCMYNNQHNLNGTSYPTYHNYEKPTE